MNEREFTREIIKKRETKQISPNLSGTGLKRELGSIKWRNDHRGIHYDKKTGKVTAT